MGMNTSNAGIKLIQQFEGCRLSAYKAVSTEKYYTIGYGHYGADVKAGMTITQKQATAYLKADLEKFETIVNNSLKVPVTQNMFDAMVSHAYNCGNAKTIATCINNNDLSGAITYCLKPNTSGGVVLAGLTKRRQAEQDLFCTDMYLKPSDKVTKATATKLEVRWIQHQLGITVDGGWGVNTAAAIKAKRKALGWTVGTGYTCTEALIKKLS